MTQQSMKIHVVMDKKTFRNFSAFDTLRYRRAWQKPVIFAAIFFVFAVICFCMRSIRDQAELMGIVLLVIGFGLPLVYFTMFFWSVSDQCKKFGFSKTGRPFYTIMLNNQPDGIQMTAKGAKEQKFEWAKLEMAYRASDAVYLYVAPNSALILPFKDVKAGGDVLWEFIGGHVDKSKMKAL